MTIFISSSQEEHAQLVLIINPGQSEAYVTVGGRTEPFVTKQFVTDSYLIIIIWQSYSFSSITHITPTSSLIIHCPLVQNFSGSLDIRWLKASFRGSSNAWMVLAAPS